MSSRIALPVLVLGHMLLGAIPSDAQCQNLLPQANGTLAMDFIRVMPGGNNFSIAAGTALDFDGAIASWNAVCGSGVPTLSKTAASPVTFTVNYMTGVYNLDNNPDACAGTPTPSAGTELRGGTITIFEQTKNGADCSTIYKELTMHEIGHRLGLNHSGCQFNLMAPSVFPGALPAPADCTAVDPFWLTPPEIPIPPPPPPFCECYYDSDCSNLYGPPEWGIWDCFAYCDCILLESPLVLHLPDYFSNGDGNKGWWKKGFCGSEAPTVCLDWWGDGNVKCTAWTEPGSDIAFVVALSDDDVLHLAGGLSVRAQPWRHFFGNVTMGPEGGFPFVHGFAALAAHCGQDPEVNSEIDLAECGSSLHVWDDRSGDGNIDSGEILELQDLGVEYLGNVRKTGKKDRCGNIFPAESHATCSGDPGNGTCGTWLDVFFEPRQQRP